MDEMYENDPTLRAHKIVQEGASPKVGPDLKSLVNSVQMKKMETDSTIFRGFSEAISKKGHIPYKLM